MDPVTAFRHLTAVRRYATASYAMAMYEYFITFDREVKTFWRRRFTFITALWFLNRYTLIFSAFPTILAFFYPFTHDQCTHFVRYPGAMQIISNIASGTTLSIRVYALYSQAWWVIAVLLPALIAEIAVESWAVQGGAPAPLPPGVPGCILTGRDDEGIKFATFWAGQLVFPTLIFIMTIIRVLHLRRLAPIRDSILTVLLRDGIMYFLVIFVANTVNVVTYIVAPDDLRFANAPFTNVITTLMICRLMLNLQQRGDASAPSENDVSSFTLDRDISRPTLLGNAGEEIGMGETYVRIWNRDIKDGRKNRSWDWEGGQESSGITTFTTTSSSRYL